MSTGVSLGIGVFSGSSVVMAGGLVALVTACFGLQGTLSLKAVSISTMVTGFLNPINTIPHLIVSSLGLAGRISIQAVSGTALGFSSLSILIACVGYCGSSILCCLGDEVEDPPFD